MRPKKKILVVDGEQSSIQSVKEILRREKYELINVGSADEALDILENEAVDVVIADIKMSGMKGNRFIKHLREWNTRAVVLFVSNESDELRWLEAVDSGASDLISRPFTKDKILKAINKTYHTNGASDSFTQLDLPAF